MLKKFSKFLLTFFLVFILSASSLVCLADVESELENVTAIETNEEDSTEAEEDEDLTESIHSGNLYLFGNEVVMDKLVDGDAFIIGNKVKITGQVNGNLYIIANQICFDGALARYSLYAFCDYIYINNGGTYESNMYIIANTLDATYSSYVARDLKAVISDVTFKGAVGRNIDLKCNTLNLGEGEDIPLIYGDLNYTANDEITVPDKAVEGNVTYSKQYLGNSLTGILTSFGIAIVTVLALYIILSKLTPKFMENIYENKISAISLLKAFGIGLATIITVAIFIILLAGTRVGILLAVILGLLFAILLIIATPIFAVRIAHSLKNIFKTEKSYVFYILVILVTIIIYALTFIPVFGFVLRLLVNIISIGLITNVFLPKRELTEEEKLAIEEKEKLKKEKAELKAAKKQEKKEAKNAKKEEKENNK